MVIRRVVIKKLALTLALGVIVGFLVGKAVYQKRVVDYIVDPSYNALPSVNLSETELWNTLKELEYHIDHTTKLYQRLTAIESRVIKERLRE